MCKKFDFGSLSVLAVGGERCRAGGGGFSALEFPATRATHVKTASFGKVEPKYTKQCLFLKCLFMPVVSLHLSSHATRSKNLNIKNTNLMFINY